VRFDVVVALSKRIVPISLMGIKRATPRAHASVHGRRACRLACMRGVKPSVRERLTAMRGMLRRGNRQSLISIMGTHEAALIESTNR
jgi:hypothetical protein